MTQNGHVHRQILTIPDQPYFGITTYDAKDPDTAMDTPYQWTQQVASHWGSTRNGMIVRYPKAIQEKDGLRHQFTHVIDVVPTVLETTNPIPSGKHQGRMEFAYDGGGLGKGGNVTLYYDGQSVGSGRVETTQTMVFSADETTDIGYESGTPVSPAYTAYSSKFTGKIHWVQLDVGKDDHDHLISPEERRRVAMARQ